MWNVCQLRKQQPHQQLKSNKKHLERENCQSCSIFLCLFAVSLLWCAYSPFACSFCDNHLSSSAYTSHIFLKLVLKCKTLIGNCWWIIKLPLKVLYKNIKLFDTINCFLGIFWSRFLENSKYPITVNNQLHRTPLFCFKDEGRKSISFIKIRMVKLFRLFVWLLFPIRLEVFVIFFGFVVNVTSICDNGTNK